MYSLSTLLSVSASPLSIDTYQRRQDTGTPEFPSNITSCPICEENYSSISSCAEAAPVLANFSMVIFNPKSFIDVIECACTDTFESAYPQCVDCFIRTNQTSFLSAQTSDLPNILKGIQSVCAIESTLLGNVSVANGDVSSSSLAAEPTGISAAKRSNLCETGIMTYIGMMTLGLIALTIF